jgi:hypothetical protein
MSSSELMISQKISSPPSVVDSSHKASCDRTKPNHLCRNKARRSVAHRRGTKRQMDYRVAHKNPCGGPRNGLSFAAGPRVRSPFPPVESRREAGRGRWRTTSKAAQESGADRDRAGGRASGSRRSRCRRGGAGAGSYEENTEIFAPRAGRAHTRARDKPAIPRRKGDPRRRRRSRSSPPMR